MTKDEFLSALKKEDRLHPIISIVIYYGKDAWDGPRSLKDMIVEMPDRIETVFSDYKMNLLQVRESSKYHFRNEDVQTVFQLSEYIFSRNFDGIKKEYEHRNIKAELATVIGTITESDVIMQQATENEGGYVSMCGALESLKKQGIEQGINQRNEEIVIQMLKREMNKGLIKEITGVDEATIDKLHKKIQM